MDKNCESNILDIDLSKLTQNIVGELKSILTNLKIIQVNLKNYFDNIENNKKILPNHLNKMLKNINFADEISLLYKILNSKSRKFLWNSDSYKNI